MMRIDEETARRGWQAHVVLSLAALFGVATWLLVLYLVGVRY
jgi:hypothetical protein